VNLDAKLLVDEYLVDWQAQNKPRGQMTRQLEHKGRSNGGCRGGIFLIAITPRMRHPGRQFSFDFAAQDGYSQIKHQKASEFR
jgi:hypothetical protein